MSNNPAGEDAASDMGMSECWERDEILRWREAMRSPGLVRQKERDKEAVHRDAESGVPLEDYVT